MTSTQSEKAARFQALHQGRLFLIPNPWDASSTRLLGGLGFQAFTTSSSAAAATLGLRDGQLSREQALSHAALIVNSTCLPVAADLEKGFSDSPEGVAETIRLAATVGLVGGSIEDATGRIDQPLFEENLAIERIAAAVAAARALPFAFTLTARCENFLRGNPNLDDAIRRLVAYEKAGADVLFAPALPTLEAVREVCRAVSKPVNFMIGMPGKSFSVPDLAEAGVRRISFAGTLYRAAMTGLINAALEAKDHGTFTYLDRSVPTAEINRLMDAKT